MSNESQLDIRKILDLLPHRYPFLLVDRVLEIVPGESLTGLKNVSMNEPFFQGHFPGLPVMPGVLQLESLAQAGGIFVLHTLSGEVQDKVFLFAGINNVKFRRPVVPGDQLILKVYYERKKLNIWKMRGVAEVDGKVACQGEFSAAIVNKGDM